MKGGRAYTAQILHLTRRNIMENLSQKAEKTEGQIGSPAANPSIFESQKIFDPQNTQILTDNSCCLSAKELVELGIATIPFDPDERRLVSTLHGLLSRKKYVLFAGTASSLSPVNNRIKTAINLLDQDRPNLGAKNRIFILDTACFSGGLGLFITLFAQFLQSDRPRSLDEVTAYTNFLSSHIMHYFIEPSPKFWNQLIIAPRTGPITTLERRFRGNRGVFNHIAAVARDTSYRADSVIWICYSGHSERYLKKNADLSEEELKLQTESYTSAHQLAKQFKRCYFDARLDLSHRLMPNGVSGLSDKVVGCFFLGAEVRPEL